MPPAARSLAAFALIAGAAAAVALAALAPGAGADTPTPSAPETPSPTPTPTASPTPTPTPSPTPTASPTPYPQSTITIRFVRDGEPVTIARTQPFSRIEADGVLCNIPVTHNIVVDDHYSISWPAGGPIFAPECLKGPPTIVWIEFLPYDVVNDVVFEPISASVQWLGEDVIVDLEIPPGVPEVVFLPISSATPTPEATVDATPDPTETPGALPVSGAGPRERDAAPATTLGLMAALVGAAVAAAAATSLRRGR